MTERTIRDDISQLIKVADGDCRVALLHLAERTDKLVRALDAVTTAIETHVMVCQHPASPIPWPECDGALSFAPSREATGVTPPPRFAPTSHDEQAMLDSLLIVTHFAGDDCPGGHRDD